MSGHSKWATTKHKKAVIDAKRAKAFAKYIKTIEVAARLGGPDPSGNPALDLAVSKAKKNSVPNDNIDRAVRRGGGLEAGGAEYQTIMYEGYGPNGLAILIECLTDNRNRAANDVRAAFNRNGGSLAEPGAVNYLFSRAGVITVAADEATEDDILLAGLEAGIEDVKQEGDTFTVTTQPSDTQAVREALEAAGIRVSASEVTMLPSVYVPVGDEGTARQVLRLVDALEDCDDVQAVYANFDIPDPILETVA